jgi:DNA-binding transcriptional regulator LsrR (DeoR family)
MPDLSSVPVDAKLYAAARLLVNGFSQRHIARLLNVSESTVTQWLKAGSGRFWLKGALQAGPALKAASKELQRQAQSLLQRPRITERELLWLAGAQHGNLLSVHVVAGSWNAWRDGPRGSRRGVPRGKSPWQAWLAEYARLAAPRARYLLSRGKLWGVTWGSQVAAIIGALGATPAAARRRRRGVLAMPLCGGRCESRLASESSSALAEALQLVLTGRIDKPLGLAMVPAFILGQLDETEVVTLWKHIAVSEAYCEVFGTERIPPAARARAARSPILVRQLHGVLTSISRDGHPFGYGLQRMYENAGYDRGVIEERYIGDIGGIGLLRPGADPHATMEQRWTGILAPDLRACADRAAQRKPDAVGVVLAASGADRVECVLESVRQGYVSHLIADESLNGELLKRVRARTSASAGAAARAAT